MASKQLSGTFSIDNSRYGCLADGNDNLVSTTTSGTGHTKQLAGAQSPDGSLYFTLTSGAGTLV
jgi:hypothetical protein